MSLRATHSKVKSAGEQQLNTYSFIIPPVNMGLYVTIMAYLIQDSLARNPDLSGMVQRIIPPQAHASYADTIPIRIRAVRPVPQALNPTSET